MHCPIGFLTLNAAIANLATTTAEFERLGHFLAVWTEHGLLAIFTVEKIDNDQLAVDFSIPLILVPAILQNWQFIHDEILQVHTSFPISSQFQSLKKYKSSYFLNKSVLIRNICKNLETIDETFCKVNSGDLLHYWLNIKETSVKEEKIQATNCHIWIRPVHNKN